MTEMKSFHDVFVSTSGFFYHSRASDYKVTFYFDLIEKTKYVKENNIQ